MKICTKKSFRRIAALLLAAALVLSAAPLALADGADKTALGALLESVADDTTEYYTSGDRYNGKTTSKNGFFTDFAISGARGRARKVYNSATATQEEVDAAEAALRAAIDAAGLIPTAQVNATELYEALQIRYRWGGGNNLSTENGPYVSSSNTTARSWAAYESALAAAEAELALLFDEDGSATAYNSSAGEAAENVTAAVQALAEAVANLDYKADEDGIADAKMGYASLNNLMTKVFNPAKMDQSSYTPESWSAFTAAYAAAQTYMAEHPEPVSDIGYWEAKGWVQAAYAFWKAGYEGLTRVDEQVHVTLSVNESYCLYTEQTHSAYCGTYEVTLSAENATLKNLLTAALGEGYNLNQGAAADAHFAYGLYINGVFISGESYSYSGQIFGSKNYDNVRLKNGDAVTLAFMYAPVWTSLIGAQTTAATADVAGDVIYYRADAPLAEATAGEDFTLRVRYNLALPADYNGAILPKEGVRVFISDAYATEAEARGAAATHEVGTTDLSGQITLNLFTAAGSAEGWYVASFFGSGERGGLGNGMNVLIHVSDPDDLSAIKTALTAKLNALYEEYPVSFYTAEQLDTVQAAYAEGLAGIAAAATSGDANAAYEAAAAVIQPIQQGNEENLGRSLESVALVLEYLPTAEDVDAGRLYAMDKELLDLLFAEDGVYTLMSEFQREQLNYSASLMIEKLLAEYQRTNGGETLPENPPVTITYKAVDIDTNEEIPGLIVPKGGGSQYDCTIYWTESGFWLLDDTILNVIRLAYSQGPTEYIEEGAEAITVPGGAYYNVRARYENTRPDEYTAVQSVSNIDGHYYSSSGGSYIGLRENAEIVVYVRKVVEPQEDPDLPYLEQLSIEYSKYSKANYTSENWRILVNAYNAGVAAIRAAETDGAKQAALDNAAAAMNAVEKKDFATYGYGTVTVCFSNTTTPRNKSGEEYQSTLYNPDEPIFTCEMQLLAEDSMMTVLLRALSSDEYNGLTSYTWLGTGSANAAGYDISYLSTVSDGVSTLAEFDGGDGSGWMGKLNDFFVNNGFPEYTVADGTLADGDIIEIVYTTNLGADVGGAWGDPDTTLRGLEVAGGELLPAFETQTAEPGDTVEYAVMIDGDSAMLTITPDAANKNYLTKTFLNEKVTANTEGNSFYKRTQPIPVAPGDTVYVGVGERAWPSMNKQGDEASSYTGTWYVLRVIRTDEAADYINGRIAALPAVTYGNYKAVAGQIAVIDSMLGSAGDGVNLETLDAARAQCGKYTDFDALREDLKAVTPNSATPAEAEAIVARYDELMELDPSLIYNLTRAEVNKIEALREIAGSAPTVLYGDANGDGKIDAKDVILLRQYIAKYDVTLDLDAADVNADGSIDAKDVILLRQYIAKYDVVLGPQG